MESKQDWFSKIMGDSHMQVVLAPSDLQCQNSHGVFPFCISIGFHHLMKRLQLDCPDVNRSHLRRAVIFNTCLQSMSIPMILQFRKGQQEILFDHPCLAPELALVWPVYSYSQKSLRLYQKLVER